MAAGEPIGFVGDSGDANGINPHLHLEGLAGTAGLAFPTVEAVEPGSAVTVWTSPAKVTLAALASEKGANRLCAQ